MTMNFLSYGQIFTHIMKQDKFEDTIWEKEIKTFVTIGETFITLETKGQTPLTYIIEGVTHRGSEEEPIILSNSSNVWGYEYHLLTRGKNSSKPYTIVITFILEEYPYNFRTYSYLSVENPIDNTKIIYYY